VRIEQQGFFGGPQGPFVILCFERFAGGRQMRGDFAFPPLPQVVELRTQRRFGWFRSSCGGALDRLNQPLDVGLPMMDSEFEGIAKRELGQVGRQICR
jgi:hypothetical protein